MTFFEEDWAFFELVTFSLVELEFVWLPQATKLTLKRPKAIIKVIFLRFFKILDYSLIACLVR